MRLVEAQLQHAEFTKDDWDAFAGAAPFIPGLSCFAEAPLISALGETGWIFISGGEGFEFGSYGAPDSLAIFQPRYEIRSLSQQQAREFLDEFCYGLTAQQVVRKVQLYWEKIV